MLCYVLGPVHAQQLGQFSLLLLSYLDTSCLANPCDLFHRLFVYFYQISAQSEQLILQCVTQVILMLFIVKWDLYCICGIEDVVEVSHEGHQENFIVVGAISLTFLPNEVFGGDDAFHDFV